MAHSNTKRTVNLYLITAFLSVLLVVVKLSRGEIFVFESVDSPSTVSPNRQPNKQQTQNNEPKPQLDNTRIITDDTEPLKSDQQDTQHQNQRTPPPTTNNNSQKKKQLESVVNNNKPDSQENQPETSRRLRDDPNEGNKNKPKNNQQQNQQNQKQATANNNQHRTTAVPKVVEERLLISISHDDDEYQPSSGSSNNKPLSLEESYPNSGLSSGYNNNNKEGSQPKRPKQSITISIQEKQSGSLPSVVLRPSENGQSIVLSVADNAGSNSKPITVHEPNSNQNQNTNLGANNGHHISSTHRPSIISPHKTPSPSSSSTDVSSSDSYGPNSLGTSSGSNSRPITSGAMDHDGLILPPPKDPTSFFGTISRPINLPPSSSSSPSSDDDDSSPSSSPSPLPPSSSNTKKPKVDQPKYPLNEKNCGVVHETRIVGGEEAEADDHMWMVAIIKSKPKDGEPRPFCGGSLITRRHILTAAHCLENLAPRDVLVRIGSYDFDDTSASSISADFSVDQFRVPAEYSKKTHAADLAIMRLKTPLSVQDNYRTICMPQARRSYVDVLGTVIGYGSQSQTFRRQSIKLRQVTVPIWENRRCSQVYKKQLNESFLCAGYEDGGRDACQGDSGGPLMVEGPNSDARMVIVGVVSHGIGCGGSYPGVYTRVSTYADWIENNTRE